MFLKEFAKFLKEYKIFSLAVAFVMGQATLGLVSSLVNEVLLSVAAPLLAIESWKEAKLQLGEISIAYGAVVADLINFLILAFLVFVIARKILVLEKEGQKK